ncbi:MAG TPA: succinylglutamate desuccinylase/aspartoacylase family protein [Casimicrobiaceae bacterium]|jgi:predicted deacylase|nr:succinylglutamate desuccinylase/aspartoacylase family protein [Casimicrobiaceae bacterium]
MAVAAPPAVPPIEIPFPALSPYAAGNAGIPYAWTFAARRPGPHILVQALTHGNEVCGAITLDWMLRENLRPERGTLSLVFANVAAYEHFDANDPYASRCVDEDFNRLWSAAVLDGPRASAELRRARELRPLYDRVDYLLDLHSMSEACAPLALAGRQRKGLALAQALGAPRHVVIDAGHGAGRRLRDYAFFDDPGDARAALLVECGQHWEASAPAVAQQTVLRWLRHFGMAADALLDAYLDPAPLPPQAFIEVTTTVTIATDAFAFTVPVRGLQTIPRAGTTYAIDGDIEIRTPHDSCVLIMPTRRPRKGETAVRLGRYVV